MYSLGGTETTQTTAPPFVSKSVICPRILLKPPMLNFMDANLEVLSEPISHSKQCPTLPGRILEDVLRWKRTRIQAKQKGGDVVRQRDTDGREGRQNGSREREGWSGS